MTFLNFTFQDPSPLISYSVGQWVEGSPTNDTLAADYSQGSFKVTFVSGSTATLTFVGTSITMYGAKRPNHGNYSVVLDSGPEFIGDGNGNNIFQFPLWNAQNLSNSEHSVVVTNIPTSQGPFFDLDLVSVGREIGPPGFTGPISNVTLDDESPFIVYNGTWSASFSSTALNSSLHSTTEAGASVSLFFQGSSVELYGLYANAPFQANLDNQLPRNLAGPDVDLNAQQQHPQTLLYFADGLDENSTHVVTLMNTVSNMGRPLYFDYAIVRSSQKFFGDTPSPNPGFTVPTVPTPTSTPTSSSSASSMAQLESRPVPVGAIVGGVVGGVGGLIILAIVGFILLRRSRYYSSPPNKSGEEGNNITPSIRESRHGITPFILPPVTQNSDSSTTRLTTEPFRKSPRGPVQSSDLATQPSYSPPASSTSASRFSQTSSQEQIATVVPATAAQPVIFAGPSGQQQGNTLITQTYILQESDAGRLVQTRLPPMYNDNWQDTSGPS